MRSIHPVLDELVDNVQAELSEHYALDEVDDVAVIAFLSAELVLNVPKIVSDTGMEELWGTGLTLGDLINYRYEVE